MGLLASLVCETFFPILFHQLFSLNIFYDRYLEKEHQKQLERERKEQRKAERGELRTEQQQHEEGNPVVEKKDAPQQLGQLAVGAAMHNEGIVRVAHSMTHDNSHPEAVSNFTIFQF